MVLLYIAQWICLSGNNINYELDEPCTEHYEAPLILTVFAPLFCSITLDEEFR